MIHRTNGLDTVSFLNRTSLVNDRYFHMKGVYYISIKDFDLFIFCIQNI